MHAFGRNVEMKSILVQFKRSNSLRSTERKMFSSYIIKKTDKTGDGLDTLADQPDENS